MTALRDQMRDLRAELRASTKNLTDTIQRISGEIDNRWRRVKPSVDPLYPESLNGEAGLRSSNTTPKKVN